WLHLAFEAAPDLKQLDESVKALRGEASGNVFDAGAVLEVGRSSPEKQPADKFPLADGLRRRARDLRREGDGTANAAGGGLRGGGGGGRRGSGGRRGRASTPGGGSGAPPRPAPPRGGSGMRGATCSPGWPPSRTSSPRRTSGCGRTAPGTGPGRTARTWGPTWTWSALARPTSGGRRHPNTSSGSRTRNISAPKPRNRRPARSSAWVVRGSRSGSSTPGPKPFGPRVTATPSRSAATGRSSPNRLLSASKG